MGAYVPGGVLIGYQSRGSPSYLCAGVNNHVMEGRLSLAPATAVRREQHGNASLYEQQREQLTKARVRRMIGAHPSRLAGANLPAATMDNGLGHQPSARLAGRR
jgi:hypothetical protein